MGVCRRPDLLWLSRPINTIGSLAGRGIWMTITDKNKGWLAGVFDSKAAVNSVTHKHPKLTLSFNIQHHIAMDKLRSLTGGGRWLHRVGERQRFPCPEHCTEPHEHVKVYSYPRFILQDRRCLIVLLNLKPDLTTWDERFKLPVQDYVALCLSRGTKNRGADQKMLALGWDISLLETVNLKPYNGAS